MKTFILLSFLLAFSKAMGDCAFLVSNAEHSEDIVAILKNTNLNAFRAGVKRHPSFPIQVHVLAGKASELENIVNGFRGPRLQRRSFSVPGSVSDGKYETSLVRGLVCTAIACVFGALSDTVPLYSLGGLAFSLLSLKYYYDTYTVMTNSLASHGWWKTYAGQLPASGKLHHLYLVTHQVEIMDGLLTTAGFSDVVPLRP